MSWPQWRPSSSSAGGGGADLVIGGLVVMMAAGTTIAVVQMLGYQGAVTALLLCLFIAAGAVGPAAVFWVYVPELYSSRSRGVLMSLATAAHWAADFVVATTSLPPVQGLSLAGAFAFHTGITGISALILGWWMPETRGCSLIASPEFQPAADYAPSRSD